MTAEPPAILLITADQLRRDALGCYGGQAVATPHLDRLAAEGTVFDQAYTASPWCLPSRASILTGQWPRQHGAYSNFRDRRLSPAVPNLYTALGAAGYRTAHVGKCHFAPVPYDATRPDRTLPYDDFHAYYRSLGIDHLRLQDDKQVSVWFADDYAKELDAAGHLAAYRDAVWNADYRKVFPFPGPAEWHPDSWVGRNAVDAITAPADRPLFAWISFSGPHFPFDPPAEYLDRVDVAALGEPFVDPAEFASPDRLHYRSFHGPHQGWMEGGTYHDRSPTYWRQLRHHYAANVALIDDQVGAVLRAAEARYGDNLAVVFSCDHGEMLGNHGFWGKNNAYYQDVLQVPLIYRRPGRAGAGSRADRLTSLVDIHPTLTGAAAAGPGPDGHEIAGRPLDDAGHDHVYAEGERFLVATDGRHKLVHAHRKGTDYTELFDLASDPHEVRDVAGDPAHAAVARDLSLAAMRDLVAAALP